MTSLAYDALTESRTYNPVTLQLQRILTTANGSGSVMDMSYNYTAGQNNGRIASSIDGVLSGTVNYSYDALNRLSTAQATNNAWGQAFTYDGNGNLTGASATVGSAPYFSTSFDASNHQTGTTYDANGNPVTWYGGNQNSTASYDVENRLVGTVVNSGQTLYSYDPAGKRVAQAQAVSGTLQNVQVYFYAITGQRIASYQLSGTAFNLVSRNLYFGGRLIRSAGNTVATDRLGSVRASTNVNGGNLVSSSYWPYGQERTSTADGREKFGTYFRDMPGQDYADQRYFNGTIGRFWTPDPGGMASANPGDPRSWNRYTYVGGDPVNYNDPSGLCGVDTGGEIVDDAFGGHAHWRALDCGGGDDVEGGDDAPVFTVTGTGIADPDNPDNSEPVLIAFAPQPPNPMPGPQAPAPSPAPRPQTNPCGFMQAHSADAKALANQMNVPVQFILAVSAAESSWGTSNITLQANNYFGVHAGVPNSSGTYTTSQGAQVSTFSGDGYLASGTAFVTLESPYAAGAPNAQTFFQDIHAHGYGIGTPNYARSMMRILNSVISRMSHCL